MRFLNTCIKKVMAGKKLRREDALTLYTLPLSPLTEAADHIRRHFCGTTFDLCTIVNAKGGNCSEDCRFCAQSVHHSTDISIHPMRSREVLVADATHRKAQGVLRYSLVTSGRSLSEREIDPICDVIREITTTVGISVCGSFGLLNEDQFHRLAKAGLSCIHNNLETGPRYFSSVCRTHTLADKVHSIRAAQKAGLKVCSGGIMGLGEKPADRIEMALALHGLGIKSVPINILNPIPGTPLENVRPLTEPEVRRIVAVYRFLLPDAALRLAGGRGLLGDQGRGCFTAGANAAITGDMLTTAGITVERDLQLLKDLGFSRGYSHG